MSDETAQQKQGEKPSSPPVPSTKKRIIHAGTQALREPSLGFPVADALFFVVPFTQNGVSTANIIVMGCIGAQFTGAAIAKALHADAELMGRNNSFGISKETLENSPLILIGALHYGISAVMLNNNQYTEAFMAFSFANGDILLGSRKTAEAINKKIQTTFGNAVKNVQQKLELTETDIQNSTDSTISGFIRRQLQTAKRISKKAAYTVLEEANILSNALSAPTTWFATGMGASATLMDSNVATAALISLIPVVLAIGRNTRTQYEENLLFPPADGKPILKMAGVTGTVMATNLGIEIADAQGLIEIFPKDRTELQALANSCAIVGNAIVSMTYIRLSNAFEASADPIFKKPKFLKNLKFWHRGSNDNSLTPDL